MKNVYFLISVFCCLFSTQTKLKAQHSPKLYKISQVRVQDSITGIADSIGTYCLLKGIVESPNLSGNSSIFFAMEDATGAITITATSTKNGYKPVIGDSVEVRGTVNQTHGLTHFDIDSIEKMATLSYNPPLLITDTLNERNESHLIRWPTLLISDHISWDTTISGGHVFVKVPGNHKDSAILEIVKGTDIYAIGHLPNGAFDLRGICTQIDSTQPYFKNYFVIPRSFEDLNYAGLKLQNALDEKVNLYPNPVFDNLIINSSISIDQVSVIDLMGRTIEIEIPGNDEYKMDLSQLKPGIYIIRIDSGGSSIYKKIVKY